MRAKEAGEEHIYFYFIDAQWIRDLDLERHEEDEEDGEDADGPGPGSRSSEHAERESEHHHHVDHPILKKIRVYCLDF